MTVEENSFYVVAKDSCVEIEEKKSRFISYAKYVKTEEQIAEFLAAVRHSHPNATHVCYAYVLGQKGSVTKNNDAGEPSGSAGVPILQAIQKKKLTNVLVVVVRYFGGKELGLSGLIRTYHKSAFEALNSAGMFVMTECAVYEMSFTYNDFAKVTNYIQNQKFPIIKQDYSDVVKIEVAFPAHREQFVFSDIKTLLGGRFINSKLRNAFFRFEIGGKK